MADENNNPVENPTPVTPPVQNDTVTLSRQEYAEMTSAIASMKTALEALVEENPPPRNQPPQEDLSQPQIDSMSNTQLLNLISDHVGRIVNESRQPLVEALANIAVKEELREVRAEYKDFDTVANDVQQMAKANPHLSFKQCYILVKAGKPAPPEMPNPETKKVLPTPTDKGGISTPTVSKQSGLSVREAAEAALAAIKYE